MALLETKIIQVANDSVEINNVNNEWGSFGWSVLSIQITHSQDSRTYTRGLDYLTGDLTTETTTINYATITYQRDKKIPNYAKIFALEQDYLRTRQELADEVARMERGERDQMWSDMFSGTRKNNLLHPIKSAKKQWGAAFNLGKMLLGVDTRSAETIKKTNELTQQCAERLAYIRQEAENLLD